MDLEALRTLIVPDIGITLDTPHPMTLGKVEETPWSAWADSTDKNDVDDGKVRVTGRIIETAYIDEFGEVIGKPQYILQHRFQHPQRKTSDESATPLTPRNMHGEKNIDGKHTTLPMRVRFPDAFAQFEKRLKGAERPYPIALLDNIPPEVLETAIALGLESVQDFASADDAFLDKLRHKLEFDKHVQRSRNVAEYRKRAQEFVGEVAEEPKPNRRRAA